MKWLPFALLALVVAVLAQFPPSADVAWQLWIGRAMSEGATLYRDIIEINPPLWFWLAVPIVRIAAWLHISGTAALVGFLGLCAALSLAMVRPLVGPRFPVVGAAMIVSFFLVGISATGEREQFTLIAVTPYVFLCAARHGCRPVSLWLAIAIGVWAGMGLCLKPFFALVPLAMQGWLFVQTRRVFPEFAAIVAVGLVYLVAVVLMDPDYIAVMRMAGRYYASYNVGPLTMALSSVVPIAVLVGIGVWMLKPDDETLALAIAGFAFFAAYVIQAKGFRYQSLPALGLLTMLAILNLRRAKSAIPMVLALLIAFITTAQQTSRRDPDAERAVADLARGSSVLIVTLYSEPAWPLVEMHGLRWASPYMFLWMHADRDLTARIANADIRRHPDRVLVDNRLGVPLNLSGYRQGQQYGHFLTFTPLAGNIISTP